MRLAEAGRLCGLLLVMLAGSTAQTVSIGAYDAAVELLEGSQGHTFQRQETGKHLGYRWTLLGVGAPQTVGDTPDSRLVISLSVQPGFRETR
jgi:hypothetical protein